MQNQQRTRNPLYFFRKSSLSEILSFFVYLAAQTYIVLYINMTEIAVRQGLMILGVFFLVATLLFTIWIGKGPFWLFVICLVVGHIIANLAAFPREAGMIRTRIFVEGWQFVIVAYVLPPLVLYALRWLKIIRMV